MLCNANIYFHKFKLIDYLHYLLSLQRFVVPAWALQPLSSPKKMTISENELASL